MPELPPTQSTVSEPIGAPIGSVQRDIERETATLKKLGVDPFTASKLDPAQLMEATYSPDELANLEDYRSLQEFQRAKGTFEATPRPTNTMMAGLEDALRTKTDVGQQQLGPSELFKQAGIPTTGVSAYATLGESLNSQSQLMNDRYGSFVNQLTKTAGAMKDTYTTVADQYSLLKEDYDRQVNTMTTLMENIQRHEQAMDLLDREAALEKEALEWKNAHPSYSDITSRERLELDKEKYYDEKELEDEKRRILDGYSSSSKAFKTTNILGSGTVTGIDGSSKWKHGLDFVLDGGMGAEVKIPLGGEVIQADTGHKKGEEKSFGNRVKVRLDDGQEIWLSHLQDVNVAKGDRVEAGQVVGTQGNTGTTTGKTGIHLDITMPKADGGYLTPREVGAYLEALRNVGRVKEGISEAAQIGKGTLGDFATGISGLKKLGGVARDLGEGAGLFQDQGDQLTAREQFWQATGSWPNEKEEDLIIKHGVDKAIDMKLESKGKEAPDEEAERDEIAFILENEESLRKLKDKLEGKSEAAAKGLIKRGIKSKLKMDLSDTQTDLMYDAIINL